MFRMIFIREIRILVKTLSINIRIRSRLGPRVRQFGKIAGILSSISLSARVLTGQIKDPRRTIFSERIPPSLVTPFLTETSGSEEDRVRIDLCRISMMSGW